MGIYFLKANKILHITQKVDFQKITELPGQLLWNSQNGSKFWKKT